MSIQVALYHQTRYSYDRLINLGPQVVRLRPAPHARTRILSYSLKITPEPHFINWQQDPQSNYLARLVFPEPTREFCVTVDLVAEMAVYNPFDFFLEPAAETFPFKYDPALNHELEPFLLRMPLTPKLKAAVEEVKRDLIGHPHAALMAGHEIPTPHSERAGDKHHDGGVLPVAGPAHSAATGNTPARTIDFLVALNQKVWHAIKYLIRLEPGVQSPEETLTRLSGSCRDSAWVLVQLLRHCGLAARFVSGYLIQLKADQKSIDGPSGAEKDFTDLHAWTEVYLPGAGWIGLDPTSGLLAGEGHIPLAATPDPSSAAPISGAVDECECKFGFEMKVARLHESPRVTLPYTEAQWHAINALGQAVDADLLKNDVRLTMGGEPTFVSLDDPDGAEWNVAALGPRKRLLADELLQRLKQHYATGGFLHHGQGKWYPGESLPRWAFGCYWRKDGFPVWENPALFADEKKEYGHTADQSAQFITTLAGRLGADPKWVMPGFEDPFYHLWKERRLPTNVDPLRNNLKDEEERTRLAKVLERGLERVVGHVLPLQRAWKSNFPAWASGPWFLRSERLYLTPGDSPMGLRLPLDSLPWVNPSDYPYLNELDPTVARPALPRREELCQRYLQVDTPARRQAAVLRRQGQSEAERKKAELLADPTRVPARGESAAWIVRTALCVEPRHGRLHIFMPPVATLEDYLELLAAVEDTAAQLQTPIIIEGSPPPNDPRLQVLKVTPDPGVIEVNLHPSATWSELVDRTTTLYAEARQTRLGTEKFMTDGRHTGTGGGNHIVIGGSTPTDSPLLRRPDLLRSLLAYWQNHPSLSFLFSGLFLGPTSQSPRVDEARNDALYELEIAFAQIKDFEAVPPWLTDRLFRNLIIDVTGNTHRTEFCIDKLYSPDSSAGRLGLLELRAFEMPPHARMSLTQQLLLRSLIAKFWREPYHARLVRWQTGIHDRFLLPHFCWEDFKEVIQNVNEAGFPLSAEWFAPHFEFRFPQHGDAQFHSLQLELRHALEPWHVLGEEGAAGGTVRYVDSSVERVQIKAQGLVDSRHIITCNGIPVPLHTTGTQGEYVAGVRYRAWQPPNCLHPNIPVHSPLVFDVVDSWNERSIGGCTYHVIHPGGRSYDTFPVNSFEAESRRLARFFRHGHTPGPLRVGQPIINPEFPLTLDLRHA